MLEKPVISYQWYSWDLQCPKWNGKLRVVFQDENNRSVVIAAVYKDEAIFIPSLSMNRVGTDTRLDYWAYELDGIQT